GKKAQEGTPLQGHVVADGTGQHGVTGFQRVQNGALGHRARHLKLDFVTHLGQGAQVLRKHDPDHGSVWTSTESTAGRSRTMGIQLSPASAEAYTCPPVVPKYMPHLSSESTAMASRSTFT